ncbi:hypothetical protein KIPB_009068, partial [Kipferlia bialata]
RVISARGLLSDIRTNSSLGPVAQVAEYHLFVAEFEYLATKSHQRALDAMDAGLKAKARPTLLLSQAREIVVADVARKKAAKAQAKAKAQAAREAEREREKQREKDRQGRPRSRATPSSRPLGRASSAAAVRNPYQNPRPQSARVVHRPPQSARREARPSGRDRRSVTSEGYLRLDTSSPLVAALMRPSPGLRLGSYRTGSMMGASPTLRALVERRKREMSGLSVDGTRGWVSPSVPPVPMQSMTRKPQPTGVTPSIPSMLRGGERERGLDSTSRVQDTIRSLMGDDSWTDKAETEGEAEGEREGEADVPVERHVHFAPSSPTPHRHSRDSPPPPPSSPALPAEFGTSPTMCGDDMHDMGDMGGDGMVDESADPLPPSLSPGVTSPVSTHPAPSNSDVPDVSDTLGGTDTVDAPTLDDTVYVEQEAVSQESSSVHQMHTPTCAVPSEPLSPQAPVSPTHFPEAVADDVSTAPVDGVDADTLPPQSLSMQPLQRVDSTDPHQRVGSTVLLGNSRVSARKAAMLGSPVVLTPRRRSVRVLAQRGFTLVGDEVGEAANEGEREELLEGAQGVYRENEALCGRVAVGHVEEGV